VTGARRPERPEPFERPDRPERAPLAAEMAAASLALADLLGGQRLPDALDRQMSPLPPASRAPARDMAYQVVRRMGRLEAISARLNARRPTAPLLALQWVALVQLLDAQRPDAIVVDQTVEAARRLPGGAAAAGFLNATLRRFGREREALLAAVLADPVARHDHPDWWLQALQAAWPNDWTAIVEVDNRQAPLVLRVNRRRTDPVAFVHRLAEAGFEAERIGPDAVRLNRAVPVESLPGFKEGDCSVQDAGAQMAAHLLDVASGQRVLDACAAPGGKTGHLLELADLDVLALDVDAERCRRIESNLARLQLPAAGSRSQVTVRVADAAQPSTWWDGQAFDRILLDAPCSASGIVRRHPDVRWLRRRGDLATLARQQTRLLGALWPLLKPGGKLLFATCSVFPEEGAEVIERFLLQHPEAQQLPLVWSWQEGKPEPIAQLLPRSDTEREHDGFFYALLTRRL
jgi:16S rRNA (cytosine967-C5)-methyltransferase